MPVRSFKPTTPSRRGTRLADRSMLSKKSGPRNLTINKKKQSGRNNSGRITVRHQGGGAKRRIRIIDWKRDKFDMSAKIIGLYFDPNRSAHLALLQYADGEKRYIIAPRGLTIGSTVIAGEKADALVGNAMKVKNVPAGTLVHCIESKPGKGASYARSAGEGITVQGLDPSGKYVQVIMPSGEIRLLHGDCMATIGQVGNEDRLHVKLGKAGRSRNLGIRPTVRGVVMHPAQHPHGGGEGKGGVGGKAKDIYGTRIGTRTRKNPRTEKMIIKTRRTKTRSFAKK
jgi:large subunit ribosomal protein L2